MTSTITTPSCTIHARPPMASYGAISAHSDASSTAASLSDSAHSSDDDDASSVASAKTPLLPTRSKNRRAARRFVTVAGLRRRAAPALRRLNPGMELVNSGSVARDHLASERTFLAYVRTSLGISSMGIALVQLFRMVPASPGSAELQRLARPLGAVLVLTGLFTLALGFTRYFAVQAALVQGKFPVARVAVAALAVLLALNVVVVFGILLGMRAAAAS